MNQSISLQTYQQNTREGIKDANDGPKKLPAIEKTNNKQQRWIQPYN